MLKNRPEVSVLLAVYNERPEFLEKAIACILNQSFRDFEFVILDDGSTNTRMLQILDGFAQKDMRIRLHREPHRGLTKTLNVGLSLCRGRLICRQDSDDWSEAERIEKQVEFMARYPEIAIVGTNVMLHQENGARLWRSNLPIGSDDILKSFQIMNPFVHGSVCLRKVAAEKAGGYCESFRCSQDYDLFWKLCERYGAANLAEVLYHHRCTAGSVSSNNCYEQVLVATTVRRLAAERKSGISKDIGEARKEVAMEIPVQKSEIYLFRQGDQLVLAGRYGLALRLFLGGFVKNPLSMIGPMKLVRLGLFFCIPPFRKRLFKVLH
jgi:glycosyltransferase involved in cell wall biosynthesis